jgi:hypothetical protein
MFNTFANLEKNLGRAASLFVLVVLGSIGMSLALAEFGYDSNVAILLVWAAMPFVAWLMSKAAHAQGKNRWLYGLASLIPPLAVFLFLSLYNHSIASNIQAGVRRHDA